MSNSSPITVIGYMHSGTTMLFKILMSNLAVYAAAKEPKFFRHLPLIRQAYPNLDDEVVLRNFTVFVVHVIRSGFSQKDMGKKSFPKTEMAPELLDRLLQQVKHCRDHGEIYRAVFDYLAQLTGNTRWVQKIVDVEQGVRYMPDGHFVEIVRDPRDVLASKKRRRLAVWEPGRHQPEKVQRNHLVKAYDVLWDSLSWKALIHAGQRARTKIPGHFLTIRYEDLVANPEAHVREICSFLDLEFEPQMLNVSWRNPAERDTGESDTNKRRGIGASSVGKWQHVLTPAEIALCQWLLKGEMQRMGYSCAAVNFTAMVEAPLLVIRSIFEFLQRLTRRWQMGGLAYLASVLLIYWKRLLQLIRL